MRDLLLGLKTSNRVIRAVVSIHNNAQVWISPYGYTTDRPADYPEMERIMKAGTDAIRATEGFNYLYGPGSEVLCKSSLDLSVYKDPIQQLIHRLDGIRFYVRHHQGLGLRGP